MKTLKRKQKENDKVVKAIHYLDEQKLEKITTGKNLASTRNQEYLERIKERQTEKQKLKGEMLKEREINHRTLKEIHTIRQENAKINLEKQQEKKK